MPIDFITPVEEYGSPTGATKVISKATRAFISSRVMYVGISGDVDNRVKTVAATVPSAVTIEEAKGGANGVRWFRLSRPRGDTITIQAKDAKGTALTSFDVSVIELPKASGPIELGQADPNHPGRIEVIVAPKDMADYVDKRMSAIGYHIYLGGFQIYCDGMNTPIDVPNRLLALDVTKAEPIDTKIYDTLDQANQAIRWAPWIPGGVTPFAYYRGAGGAVIAPTIFSPVTTPRIITTYYEARRLYADYVQQSLTGIAISIALGIIIRIALGRILRATEEDPKPPRRTLPPPEPPVVKRLHETAVDLQDKNPVRTVEVLKAPKTYRHSLTSENPAGSYVGIEKGGKIDLSSGANAHYGEGVYAWHAGAPRKGPYIDIEVPAGTGVETLNFGGGQSWVRMMPPTGDTLNVRIVGTNLAKELIDMMRKLF